MQNNFNDRPLLEISLLGRFQAKIDGVPVDEKSWGRRSAKSLVKLLAVKPFHALHREQIMDLLWVEQSPETAVNNLNKAIYKARRTLEPDLAKGSKSRFIITQKNQIILESPGMISVDLDEFERLANYSLSNNDMESGQKALELYRGELLIEDIYEDWIFTRRESTRILFRKTATKTAELFAAQNNLAASIEILKKLIAEDATDEHIQRLLMRFYAETGSKFQALKQFEMCRTALHNLGIEPEPKTIELEQSIKRGEIIPSKNDSSPVSIKSAATNINPSPRITPLTFQRGDINSARFLPDGETIVLSALWNGGVTEIYSTRLKTGETNTLEIKDASVFSVSSTGEKAIALRPRRDIFVNKSTLAKFSSASETPFEILEDVQEADWHPSKNGQSAFSDTHFLAVVRDDKGKNCLEFPVGKVICETSGWISHPRFSPDGSKIAFIEHPLTDDDAGFVAVLDIKGKSRTKQILSNNWVSIMGLAWRDNEVWFSATREGTIRNIYAVNLQGEERRIYSGMGNLTLRDISKKGEVLITVDQTTFHTIACHASDGIERDLSWHDWILIRSLTDDGETLLFEEAGVSGGNHFSSYLREVKGSSIKKIGDGSGVSLSPDGKHALLRINLAFDRLVLVTIETGEIKQLETDSSNPLIYQPWASFFPDGKRIIFSAIETNRRRAIYVQNIDGGKPVRFTTDEGVEMLSSQSISPDGKYLILTDNRNGLSLQTTTDGVSTPLKNLQKTDLLIRWADDGENIFIWRRGDSPTVVYKYNLATGKKKKWLEIMLKDDSRLSQILGIRLTPDCKTYVYSYTRKLSDLYLMEDLV